MSSSEEPIMPPFPPPLAIKYIRYVTNEFHDDTLFIFIEPTPLSPITSKTKFNEVNQISASSYINQLLNLWIPTTLEITYLEIDNMLFSRSYN